MWTVSVVNDSIQCWTIRLIMSTFMYDKTSACKSIWHKVLIYALILIAYEMKWHRIDGRMFRSGVCVREREKRRAGKKRINKNGFNHFRSGQSKKLDNRHKIREICRWEVIAVRVSLFILWFPCSVWWLAMFRSFSLNIV